MVNPDTASNQKAYTQPNSKTAIEVKANDLPIQLKQQTEYLYEMQDYIDAQAGGPQPPCQCLAQDAQSSVLGRCLSR